MKLGLQLWPVHLMAADDERFKLFLLGCMLQSLSHALIMPAIVICLMTFSMTAVIARIPITASATWKMILDGSMFVQFIELNFEKTRALTVDKCDPQSRNVGE